MLRIRFQRVGLKRQPSYRIVVTDGRKSRAGAELEVIGFHNPRTRPSTDDIKFDRALYWLSVGAQPSEAVTYMLKRNGTMQLLERLKKGEALEDLASEAQAAKAAAAPISPKTRFPAPASKSNAAPAAE
ncbi:MAG: 30S ribosomal protein S16 [Anaerolineae bacterium]|nr:30S ribosomal protein S16 [Anaerolineae bacterium]